MSERRLLIVDDESDIRFANKTVIGSDWAISEADGFLSAQAQIEKTGLFDAYLIDIVMPLEKKGMDPGLVEGTGIRFIQWLLIKDPGAAIVVLTVRGESMLSLPEFKEKLSSKFVILPKFRISSKQLRNTLNAVTAA
jgi:CheY-like chemotaxis protein